MVQQPGERRPHRSDTVLPMERIELVDGDARAEVVPARGGLISRFEVGGRPVLYLDQATLEDPGKNVRGGVPFLFPAAGRLDEDRYGDREMKQHGFARNLPFAVERRGAAASTLSLSASDETRARFPFEFRVELEISVSGTTLRIDQRYLNRGTDRMPLHVGFHPYFFVPDADKPRVSIDTRATRAFDNAARREVAFTGFDFTRPEVDLHLHDHGGSVSALHLPDGRTIGIEGSPELSHFVVWALAGKDFICVEPWTAPANALNSGQGLLWIEPGGERRLSLAIRVA
jgi:galactose mutarotase-like enzyme